MATDMTSKRWTATCAYLNDVFGAAAADTQIGSLMQRAVAAGLPDIAVDAAVGRSLQFLCSMTDGGRGADIAIEVGTLAGHSALWIARGLAPAGKLVTIEKDPKHTAFAQREFARAEFTDRIDLRQGAALDVLPELGRELGDNSVDFVFLDAIKVEYKAYLGFLSPMLKAGALLVADNALGGGSWWIDDAAGTNDSRDAMDAFNRAIARDERFDSVCVPIRQGLLIARQR